MERRTASLALPLLVVALSCRSVRAQEQTPLQPESPAPSSERDLEEIARNMRAIVERTIAEAKRSIEAYLDPQATAEEARRRFDLSPEEVARVRPLLEGMRDAATGRKAEEAGRGPGEDRDGFRDRAVEALGPERGRAFSDWVVERRKALPERIARALKPLGEEIGRSSERLVARIVERVKPQTEEVEKVTLRAARLAERAAREAVAEVQRALAKADLDSPSPDEPGEPSRRRQGRGAESRPSLLPDRIRLERKIRESLRGAEKARVEAERALRETLERISRETPAMTREAEAEIRRAVEEALREVGRHQEEAGRAQQEAVRRALEESARAAKEAGEWARRGAEEEVEGARRGAEAERAAQKRAMELERERLGEMRSHRQDESEELRRARGEIERMRQRVEELERRLRERAESRPARSPI
ncbi:MAG TPA: hypothetical protein VFI25_08035 [Planctomycetota bacterium]|jgi:hypothetical protein|nr:hypothetical protein [Planctomycetota bacterium]